MVCTHCKQLMQQQQAAPFHPCRGVISGTYVWFMFGKTSSALVLTGAGYFRHSGTKRRVSVAGPTDRSRALYVSRLGHIYQGSIFAYNRSRLFMGRQSFLSSNNSIKRTTPVTTTVLPPIVRDYPGEPVPEETFTHLPS